MENTGKILKLSKAEPPSLTRCILDQYRHSQTSYPRLTKLMTKLDSLQDERDFDALLYMFFQEAQTEEFLHLMHLSKSGKDLQPIQTTTSEAKPQTMETEKSSVRGTEYQGKGHESMLENIGDDIQSYSTPELKSSLPQAALPCPLSNPDSDNTESHKIKETKSAQNINEKSATDDVEDIRKAEPDTEITGDKLRTITSENYRTKSKVKDETDGLSPDAMRQKFVHALELYKKLLEGGDAEKKNAQHIDNTMSIFELLNACQAMLVEVPLSRVWLMAKSEAIMQYAERIMKEQDVTQLVDDLLEKANTRSKMAKELNVILAIHITKSPDSGDKDYYRTLGKKLIQEQDPTPTGLDGDHKKLSRAIVTGQWEIVKAVFLKTMRVPRPELNTVCRMAVQHKDWDVFLDCAARGADLMDQAGDLMLHAAFRDPEFPFSESFEVLHMTKQLANSRDASGTPLLHAALLPGLNVDVIMFLLQNGADVNAKDSQGKTAMQILITEAVKHIETEPESFINMTDTESGNLYDEITSSETPKDNSPPASENKARQEPEHNRKENLKQVVKVMVAMVTEATAEGQVIDWSAADNGWTALHVLCAAGNHTHIRHFIDHGADPRVLRAGLSLMDTVVWQDELSVDSRLKMLTLLLKDLGLADFQFDVVRARMQNADQQSTTSQSRESEAAVDADLKHDTRDQSFSRILTEENTCMMGRKVLSMITDCIVHGTDLVPGFSETDASPQHCSCSVQQQTLVSNIPIMLSRFPELKTFIRHLVKHEMAEVFKLTDRLLEEAESKTAVASELLAVFSACHKGQDPDFRRLQDVLEKACRTHPSTIEEALKYRDWAAVLALSRPVENLTKRELTIAMLAATQNPGDLPLFYDCAQRGGCLTGFEPSDHGHDDEPQNHKPIPSPLHEAIRNKHFDLSKLLSSQASSFEKYVNVLDLATGQSLLHVVAEMRGSERRLETMKLLLSYGADVNLKNNAGQSVLQYLVARKDCTLLTELVRLAVAGGTTIDWTPAPDGWTALHVLCAHGAFTDIPYFVQHGDDPKALRPLSARKTHIGCTYKIKYINEPDSSEIPQQTPRHEDQGSTKTVADLDPKTAKPGSEGVEEKVDYKTNTPRTTDTDLISNGLTLLDTVILTDCLPPDAKFNTLVVLLQDLKLGPYHAAVVNARQEGQYEEWTCASNRMFRYPLTFLVDPIVLTHNTYHFNLTLVKLMATHGAIGDQELDAAINTLRHLGDNKVHRSMMNYLEGLCCTRQSPKS